MNHYYTPFQEDEFHHETAAQWKNYGIRSFKNLLYFLGYPKGDSMDYLKDYCHYEEFDKAAVVQQQGALCQKFYFIISGKLKITIEKDGVPVIFALFNEGNIASSLFDFFEETPSSYHIESCSKLKCISMSKAQFDRVRRYMDAQGLGNVLMNINQNFLKFTMWFQGYQSLPTEKRIADLIRFCPEIISGFRDSDIAAFLGIRRETYSRLKKKFNI